MKLIFLCLLLCGLSVQNVLSGPAAAQCYDKATNHYWPAGQEYRPIGQCASIRCSAQGQRSSLTCPINQPPSGQSCTKLPADLRRQYPDCCPKYNCAG